MRPPIWFSLALLPMIAVSQQLTPAAEADRVLRERVTQFLQYHVDGTFMKAYDMVADDTKEEYFSSGKVRLLSFKIDDVKFADNFTKATVNATISKTMVILDQILPMTLPSKSTWKIENGKWVWYSDPQINAGEFFGPQIPGLVPSTPKNPQPPTVNSADIGFPKDFDEKSITAAAQGIFQQLGVDKNEVTLATNKSSEDRVVFHNGLSGGVQLELNVPEVPGFTVKMEQAMVKAGADVPVVFRYEPGNAGTRREPVTVQLLAQPLNQIFTIRVSFSAAGASTPK